MRGRFENRGNWLGLALALVAALAAISCGGGNAATTNNSSTTKANLLLNDSSLDFGNVSVGSSKGLPITLTNSADSGGPSITISQITVSGTGFSGNIPGLPLVLAAGQSSTLTITFAPTSAGAASGTLSIVVEGASGPVTVPLTGTGIGQGQLGVSPPTLNFGNVSVGNSKSLTGTLTAGSSNIHVSSATWSGQGYSVSGISFPLTVTAGGSVSFTVTFAPEISGSSTGSVSFVSDASNSPTVENFTGTGTQVTQHTVDLSWDASTDVVVGYNVYRGTQTGGPYTRLNSSLDPGTTYADSSVVSGSTYFYVATAVNASSEESAYSNEVIAVVPNP